MANPIITFDRNGKKLSVIVRNDMPVLFADGKEVGDVAECKPTVFNGITCTFKAGSAMLSPEVAGKIMGAFNNSDEGKMATLRRQRAGLAMNLSLLRDYSYDHGRRQINRGGRMEKNPYGEKIEAAKSALAAFDEAHPEVVEAIRAAADARRESNVAAGPNA